MSFYPEQLFSLPLAVGSVVLPGKRSPYQRVQIRVRTAQWYVCQRLNDENHVCAPRLSKTLSIRYFIVALGLPLFEVAKDYTLARRCLNDKACESNEAAEHQTSLHFPDFRGDHHHENV
jgi:hypothetical protein